MKYFNSFQSVASSRVVVAALLLLIATNSGLGQGNRTLDSDAASKAFNEAKNWIGAGAWDAAAEKLKLVITAHSDTKYYEPAIYWLTYVCHRQGKHEEALVLLDNFVRQFPESRWRGDARTLRVEIAGQVGNTEIINEELRSTDNEEVRLAALTSLFRLHPEKGLGQAAGFLDSGSESSSRHFREGVVRLIGQYGGQEAAPVLLKIAHNKTGLEVVRTASIFALKPHINDDVLAQLVELVMKGDAPAVVEAAMFIFVQRENEWAKAVLLRVAATAQLTDTRKRAIHFLSLLKSGAAIAELSGLYDTVGNVEVQRAILATLTKTRDPSAQSRVFEISSRTDDVGLREEGILSLGKYGDEQIITRIIQLYDVESRDEVKRLILSSLSKSKHRNAFDKLTDVAQKDKSLTLRQRAAQFLKQRATRTVQ